MEIGKLSNKQNFSHLKKRKFHGNRINKAKEKVVVPVQQTQPLSALLFVVSSSGKKLNQRKMSRIKNNNKLFQFKNLVSLLKYPENVTVL